MFYFAYCLFRNSGLFSKFCLSHFLALSILKNAFT